METGVHPRTPREIVLYDGECGFCDFSVQFILAHDPAGRFSFAPLQSPMGQELLALRGRQANLDTIVLIDGPEVLDRSDAVFRITGRLAGWKCSRCRGLRHGFAVRRRNLQAPRRVSAFSPVEP